MDREDADTLSLGKVFENADCLLNCEVAVMMEEIAAADEKVPDSFHEVLEYVRKFSKFKQRTAVNEVEDLLALEAYSDLHPFQRASIANLLPETIEEARALIPSLDIDDDNLQHLLTNLKNTQNFAGTS